MIKLASYFWKGLGYIRKVSKVKNVIELIIDTADFVEKRAIELKLKNIQITEEKEVKNDE